jgi:hypothetical protein
MLCVILLLIITIAIFGIVIKVSLIVICFRPRLISLFKVAF